AVLESDCAGPWRIPAGGTAKVRRQDRCLSESVIPAAANSGGELMVIGVLPEDGPAQVGPVTLPPGRRQFASENGQPVAWSTIEPMPTAGLVWHALSAVSADTGLTPVPLEPAPPSRKRPRPTSRSTCRSTSPCWFWC